MARWDEILSLPVQNPPSPDISASDLVWSKVEGHRDIIDRLALIPFARVDDFVRGESANKDCPTRFHVEARRRRPPDALYKPKVDGILEYILYWCSFGPDDHRKGGIVRPSRTTYVPKKKPSGRPNTKRGCTCHFIVKRLIAEPSVALIIYNQDKHVDKKGLPCHGPQDKKAVGTHAMYAPYISEDLRLRVLSLLHVGVPVETIMQRHNESVEKQGGPCNRDDLLTHRYVRRQERSIRRSQCELDADDDVSISLWVESHRSHVFFYADFSDSDPFVLGIQTEWQLQQMIRFGNGRLLASDSRFGTNKLKYPIHTIVVFNSDNKAIPVAWIIAPKFSNGGDTHRWMRALYNNVHTKDPTWKLAGFIVDDPSADILTIREVFQCSVLICFWRVRHAWHKNLMKRCSDVERRTELSRWLGQAVKGICKGLETRDLFENFMEDFVDCSDFMEYFKATWYQRMGPWITALKTLPLASLESCAALEFYHSQFKIRLLNEEDPTVYQRADWLVTKICTKVHAYFWLDEYAGKDGFQRYWKDEWVSGLTYWRKSLMIPDTDVVTEGKFVNVFDQKDRGITHVVRNPGSEYAICSCSWAAKGNLCEHVFKVITYYRDKGSILPSLSLIQYSQALVDMLNCPPHDSFIRDQAVSLAVWVQEQLLTQIVQKSTQHATDSSSEQENTNSQEDCSGQQPSGNPTDENVDSHVNMEVDPSIICDTGPQLNSLDGFASAEAERISIDESPDIGCFFGNTSASTAEGICKYGRSSEYDTLYTNTEDMTDIDILCTDMPPPDMDSLKQCTMVHHQNQSSMVDDHHENDNMVEASENIVENDTKNGDSDIIPTLPSVPINSHLIENSSVTENSGLLLDDCEKDDTLPSVSISTDTNVVEAADLVVGSQVKGGDLENGTISLPTHSDMVEEASDNIVDDEIVNDGQRTESTLPSVLADARKSAASGHMTESMLPSVSTSMD